MVPGEGLEPSRPNEHMPLKHACLPISAPGRKSDAKVSIFSKNKRISRKFIYCDTF